MRQLGRSFVSVQVDIGRNGTMIDGQRASDTPIERNRSGFNSLPGLGDSTSPL